MTGLDKWKNETVSKIMEMDVWDAHRFIEDEYHHKCEYCKYSFHTEEFNCEEEECDCEEGIKKYLESEVEE